VKLLLHTCCAPCAIYPALLAKRDNFSVTAFFANSNIHPEYEYNRRKKGVRDYFKSEAIETLFPTYSPYDFFSNKMADADASRRCRACWTMRIKETIGFAESSGYEAFSTTLLGSPYQDHAALREICLNLSRGKKTQFYYKDFRDGFSEAHNTAKKKGMYCQDYCGCVFSMMEREESKRSKKKETPHLRVGNSTGVSL